jgi:hypothetical protein
MSLKFYGIPAPLLTRWIMQEIFPDGVRKWVDLGIGNGEYIRDIGFLPKEGLGVDVGEPKIVPPHFSIENKNIQDWLTEHREDKVPLLTMFDVIEHFEKGEAIALINKAESISDALIVATPSGFLRQDAETHPEDRDNPWNWHRSGFSPEDLESLGFVTMVLKNAHLKPAGNDRSFDKLIAFKTKLVSPRAISNLRRKAFMYNLKPLHFFRTVRDVLLRPRLL